MESFTTHSIYKVFIKVGEEVKQKNLTQWKRDNQDRSVDEYNKEKEIWSLSQI